MDGSQVRDRQKQVDGIDGVFTPPQFAGDFTAAHSGVLFKCSSHSCAMGYASWLLNFLKISNS
jgi:hypothetical protein